MRRRAHRPDRGLNITGEQNAETKNPHPCRHRHHDRGGSLVVEDYGYTKSRGEGRSLVKRPTVGRGHRKLYLFAVAVLCAVITALVGAVPAGAAQSPRSPRESVRLTLGRPVRISALPPNKPAVASFNCEPYLNGDDRTQLCWEQDLTFTFYADEDGVEVEVGFTTASIVQFIQLNANGTGWTEDDTVPLVVNSQTTAPVYVSLAATCAAPCLAVAHFGGLLATGLTGTVDYTDSPAPGTFNTRPTQYTLTFDAPPYIPTNEGTWDSPQQYRCDNNLRGIAGPGCVFPDATPSFLVPRAEYGASAAMVQWAQKHLSAHWGALAGEPLTRLADTDYRDDNRRIICERAWKAFAPWTADNGKIVVADSCDEFPFASTYQSGAMLNGMPDESFSGAQCAQLQAVKTANSGSVAAIWNDVEVVPGTTYSAGERCVRGHIPITLNEDLGAALKKFIGANRVLNGDGYTLYVWGK